MLQLVKKNQPYVVLLKHLRKHGALDYSIVVTASASQPAPLLYLAPYAGVCNGRRIHVSTASTY